MKAEELYNLELHESQRVDEHTFVTRVPGGWMYEFQRPQVQILEVVFVPFNNEFQKTEWS